MKLNYLTKKYSKLNIYILAVLFLLGFSLFYFIYNSQRSQKEIFVAVSLVREKEISISTIFNWIPRWIADSIEIGDTEISPFGGINASVVDKEVYDSGNYLKQVYLLMKVRSNRDRSGIYLYKNKPLLVGSIIGLKLTKADIDGWVTYIGSEPPQYKKEKLIVKLKGTQIESWVAEGIKVGSTIINSKGEVEAKVLDKKSSLTIPIGMRYEVETGKFIYNSDVNRKDIDVTVEIITKKIDGANFYAETSRIKLDNWLTLQFNDFTINMPIISIEHAKD